MRTGTSLHYLNLKDMMVYRVSTSIEIILRSYNHPWLAYFGTGHYCIPFYTVCRHKIGKQSALYMMAGSLTGAARYVAWHMDHILIILFSYLLLRGILAYPHP